MSLPLYEQMADQLCHQIRAGTYGVGQRVPGVRRLSRQYQVSVSTAVQAVQLLEDRGWLEARPRSGFYVKRRSEQQSAPLGRSNPPAQPSLVTSQAMALAVSRASTQPDMVQFGAAVPAAEFMPRASVARALDAVRRQSPDRYSHYQFPPGLPELRQQLAQRLAGCGLAVGPDEILITCGAQEALSLSLRVLTKPGDVVAVESPIFYGLLQILDSLGLQVLEIPTDPDTGISLSALELALERWPVNAVVAVPNFSNPTGYLMPEARKRGLLELLSRHDVPLVEDDVYGELAYEGDRPPLIKAYDREDRVFSCGSISKTVDPGLRIGWVVPPAEHRDRLDYLKFTSNLSVPTLNQMIAARVLARGGLDRHLRQVRERYRLQMDRFRDYCLSRFPEGTRVTQPQGGFLLWLEMPAPLSGERLYDLALAERISISPGVMFSATGKYAHHIRLNCAMPWDRHTQHGLDTLGTLARSLTRGS